MKERITLILVILALAVLTVSAKPNRKDEKRVIDKLKYTITYRTKSVIDTTQTDSTGRYNYKNDDACLEIGEKISYFYSATRHAYEKSLPKQMILTRLSQQPQWATFRWTSIAIILQESLLI